MSKMTKKQPKAGKIPRGLTDKDMFRDYVEEESLEDVFVAAEKAAATSLARSRFSSNTDCSRETPPSSISTAKDARNSWEAMH